MAQLFLVPTPIGNLKDMTFRAVEVLNEVDLILAEDTRTSAKLMQHFEINTPLHSHHMHNEHSTLPKIIRDLKQGKNIALISDAGVPASEMAGVPASEKYCLDFRCGNPSHFRPWIFISKRSHQRRDRSRMSPRGNSFCARISFEWTPE